MCIRDSINSHILFGMNGYSVTDTVIGGRVLMENRVILGVDEKEIMKESRQVAAALWRRVNGGC